jgi:hypothetical protein
MHFYFAPRKDILKKTPALETMTGEH